MNIKADAKRRAKYLSGFVQILIVFVKEGNVI